MIILNRLVVGGTAMNTLHLINALKKDYNVILVTGAKEQDELEVDYRSAFLQHVEHIRLPALVRSVNPVRDLAAFKNIKKLIKKYRPQLLQTIGAKPGFIGRVAAWQLGVPVIMHAYHGDVFHSYFNPLLSKTVIWLERFAASKSTCITTVSAKQKNELENVYQIAPAKKIVHIPIGIQVAKFFDDAGTLRHQFRQQYLLDEHEIAIGIIGRIVPVKNHELFLQIVKAFYDKQEKNTRFFIIGDGAGLRQKLEDKLRQWKIDFTYYPENKKKAFVTFTSWISNIQTAVNGLDMVVLTSRNEGTPVSLIEAQAAGKPIVSSNAGAIDEVMLRDVSGFICNSKDPSDYIHAIQQLISNPELRFQMGQSGKSFVQKKFQLSTQVAATLALYESLLSS